MKKAIRLSLLEATLLDKKNPKPTITLTEIGGHLAIQITLGIKGLIVDADLPVNDVNIKNNFRDAVIDDPLFDAQNGSITISKISGSGGSKFILTATLGTKVPGTGAALKPE